MKPDKLNREMLMSYVEKYGYKEHAEALKARDGCDPDLHMTGGIDNLDDFAACKFTRKEDWVDLYVKPYYFGCEADDRMNATAFLKLNPFNAQLNAIYSSDIGHFGVIDMHARRAVGRGENGRGRRHHEANFRDFVFTNAVTLWGTPEIPISSRARGSKRKPQRCFRANRAPAGNGRRRQVAVGVSMMDCRAGRDRLHR